MEYTVIAYCRHYGANQRLKIMGIVNPILFTAIAIILFVTEWSTYQSDIKYFEVHGGYYEPHFDAGFVFGLGIPCLLFGIVGGAIMYYIGTRWARYNTTMIKQYSDGSFDAWSLKYRCFIHQDALGYKIDSKEVTREKRVKVWDGSQGMYVYKRTGIYEKVTVQDIRYTIEHKNGSKEAIHYKNN